MSISGQPVYALVQVPSLQYAVPRSRSVVAGTGYPHPYTSAHSPTAPGLRLQPLGTPERSHLLW